MAARKKERILSRSRYQVKRRRRREGKTDYQHRTNLIRQDCNKHGAVKSRLVVRKTNTKIIVSIIQAFMNGDRVVTYADSTELKRYGVDFGLTNYFAAYATGMLCARRTLEKMGETMKTLYPASRDAGKYVSMQEKEESYEDNERGAYKVFLDIGLARATLGARVFAAMKGASDGGLLIPHGPSKLYGYDPEKESLDSSKLRDKIFHKQTTDYMISLRDNEPEKYQKLFSGYIAKGVQPESIEEKLKACIEGIISNPSKPSVAKPERTSHYPAKVLKLSAEERRARVNAKLASTVNE